MRACLEWAKNNGIVVDAKHIYIDEAKTGRTHNRLGLQRLIDALARNEFDVVISFATNRLYRKLYRSLQFVHEHIVDQRKRCVFVSQGIDTDRKDPDWSLLMTILALIDEWQTKMYGASIRAGHHGKLLREEVGGALAFGYHGVVTDGRETRKGAKPKKIEIKEDEAVWVRRIFAWFVDEEMAMAAIARRLNRDGAPPPPMTKAGRWQPGAVRYLLHNDRYIGDWSYGKIERIWQNKAGYGRQYKREQPLYECRIERLRLIDDVIFHRAQERLAGYAGHGGRKPGNGRENDLPYVLKELLWCPMHERTLIVCGSTGYMVCPDCKRDDQPHLYSMLHRPTATRLLCEKLAELIRNDQPLVHRVLEAFKGKVAESQQPLPEERQRLVASIKGLTTDIGFILRAPGKTETDRRENETRLNELRVQRAAAEAKLATHDHAASLPARVPDEQQVQAQLDDLASTLEKAVESTDPEIIAAARRIVRQITGGKIMLSQQGEATARHGWLRGTFDVNVVQPIAEQLGIQTADPAPIQASVDFRESSEAEQLADEVKQLLDEGLLIKQIRAEVSKRHGREFGKALITKAINHWYSSRGLKHPDGRTRRSTLKRMHVEPTRCEDPALIKRVMDAYHNEALLLDIAASEQLNINTITAIIRRWHERQGLPVPDGRTRRKSLKDKTRRQEMTA